VENFWIQIKHLLENSDAKVLISFQHVPRFLEDDDLRGTQSYNGCYLRFRLLVLHVGIGLSALLLVRIDLIALLLVGIDLVVLFVVVVADHKRRDCLEEADPSLIVLMRKFVF